MCGRFVLWITLIIPEHYGLPEPEEPILPSYNIAPGQEIVAVVQTPSGRNITRLKWGLIPSWTRNLAKAPKSINFRSPNMKWEVRVLMPCSAWKRKLRTNPWLGHERP